MVERAVLKAFYLSATSYVKPGAVHRLTTGKDLDRFILSSIAALPIICRAAEAGRDVAKGRRGMPDAGIGSMILDAARSAYAWLGSHPLIDVAVAAVHASFALSYSYARRGEVDPGEYRSALGFSARSSSSEDLVRFLEALKTVGEFRLLDILEERRITVIRASLENLNLVDAYRVLAEARPIYGALTSSKTLSAVESRIMEEYKKHRDMNVSVVNAYVGLLAPRLPNKYSKMLERAVGLGLMTTRDGARALLELDRRLRMDGVDFTNLIPVLAVVLVPLTAMGYKL